MEFSFGIIAGEICGRNNCTGVLYERNEGECTCHLGHPPCSYCTNCVGCCEECGWNEKDSLQKRKILIEKYDIWAQIRKYAKSLNGNN